MLLAIWAMLPVLLLSFASNKETSYILPSCAAAALLAAWWLDEHLLPGDAMQWRDIGWLMIVLPAVVMNIFFSWMDVWTYQAIGLFVLAPAVLGLAVTLRRRRFVPGTFGLLGAALYLVILCHSPNVDAVTWGFGRALSSEVWSRVGQAELYLYHPDDIARGCIPFYRNRLTPEIDRPSELQRVLASDQKVFVLMRTQRLDRLHPAEIAAGTWMLHALPDLDPDHRYVLISNVRD